MKFKKIAAVFAAAAAIASMSVTVSAADWSQMSWADNDPNTCKFIEATADGVTFTNSVVNTDVSKTRLTLDKILKNPDDYSKIKKMTWTCTYKGITPEFRSDIGLSGGTWATNVNAQGYTIRPEYDDDDNQLWEDKDYVIEDFVEWGVDDKPACPEKDGEMVFMDWSNADIAKQGVTLTISNLKIFDADGNEIEQLGYEEWNGESEDGPIKHGSEGGAAETEAPVAETPAAETSDAEETANTGLDDSAKDNLTTDNEVVNEKDDGGEKAAETGNEGIFAAVAAVAASAVVLGATQKKRANK